MFSFPDFLELTNHGNVIPLHIDIFADTETPVSLYQKLRQESPYSFLLESVERGERVGRYSFIGVNPFALFRIRDSHYSIECRHEDVVTLPELIKGIEHPLEALKTIFSHYHTVPIEGIPPLASGAVGYFGYEIARLIENLPVPPLDELSLEDSVFMFMDTIVVFDSVNKNIQLVSNAYVPEDATVETKRMEYQKALNEITSLRSIIDRNTDTSFVSSTVGTIQYEVPEETFLQMVVDSKKYIEAGDVFQVLPSHRCKQEFQGDPFSIYRMMRRINPSPYMYYFHLNGTHIIGSSPELLVRVKEGMVETRPIAGTRPRGKDAAEDLLLQKELLEDTKELAEHLMLIDLGRNDIGRISEFGSVQVNEYMTVEKYSHVMHIVSNVQGVLKQNITPVDALLSCFPAGTLTGAPKIRAMEIIAELEPSKRGIYGGAIGYFDFSGNLDSCIAIRTAIVKDGFVFYQAGAGIVNDSIPHKEYEETLHKMNGIIRSVQATVSQK